uniref:Ground-like domain-containing protein n=1 Tax=Meloidogyne enterolobii TaxID=390850 RepID=A0A6V7UU86_MELEN|nr:unnamed protein product [Meloidogyne enterolobii]
MMMNFPLPLYQFLWKKEDEDNLCNHYKRKDQQKFQNKIIRLAPIQPIFTSVKENPLHWNFGSFNKNKENPGGCGGDEQQQQLTLMPLEQENRLKASADKTRNLQIPLPSIQQQPPPPPPQLSPLQFPPPPPLPPPLIQPFLPLQFPNNLFPTLPSLITTPPFQPTSFANPLELAQQHPEKEYLKELENVPEDYLDEQENKLPCPERAFGRGCQKQRDQQQQLQTKQKASSDVFIEAANEKQQQQPSQPSQQFLLPSWSENREMCNSNRLRSLIYQLLVNTKINDPTINVERSKRFLQQKAESLFGNFYNVICGTGFFSYIAHTDEFCLVAVKDIHCYVFSPVCSSTSQQRSIITSRGIEKQKRLAEINKNSRNTKNKN